MPEQSIDSWTQYAVGSSNSSWDQLALTTVTHVTHVESALAVLQKNSIQPGLICDESRLNTKRILVVWLSPNDWSQRGYRYGNVGFEYDWADIVGTRTFYWVGVMKEYRPTACRILLTDRNRNKQLPVYIPENGPWIIDKMEQKHYWNGKYTLEIMLEAPLELALAKQLRFVDHHPSLCSVGASVCADVGNNSSIGASRFLAGACGRSLLERAHALWIDENSGRVKPSLEVAWNSLSSRIGKGVAKDSWGSVKSRGETACAVARAAMNSYCQRKHRDRKALVQLFKSLDHAIDACAHVIEMDLGLSDVSLDRD